MKKKNIEIRHPKDENIKRLLKENANLKLRLDKVEIERESLKSELKQCEESREIAMEYSRDLNDLNSRTEKSYLKQIGERQKHFTYNLKVLIKAKEIYLASKGKKPKVTHADALVSANRQLEWVPENALRENGFDKPFLFNMIDSFKKQFKDL